MPLNKKKVVFLKKADLGVWVRPVTPAKYWTGLMGRIDKCVKGKGANALVLVKFTYATDGKALAAAEYMEFPVRRLAIVSDFSARVRKHSKPGMGYPEAEYDDVVTASESHRLEEHAFTENLTLNPELSG